MCRISLRLGMAPVSNIDIDSSPWHKAITENPSVALPTEQWQSIVVQPLGMAKVEYRPYNDGSAIASTFECCDS